MPVETGFPDRDAVLNYLHDQLIGPIDGSDELLEEKPHERYLTGILYPQAPTTGNEQELAGYEEELVDEGAGQLGDDNEDDPITLSGQTRPSSVGISFVATAWTPVEVGVRAGLYTWQEPDEWRREAVDLTGEHAVRLAPGRSGVVCARSLSLLDGRASIQVRWRPNASGAVVTVVLINNRPQRENRRVDSSDCLFQVELHCRPTSGEIARYPGRRHLDDSDEEAELGLQYRNVPVYAIGHGSAATWDRGGGPTRAVCTTFLPVHVVPDVAFDVPGSQAVFRLSRLAGIEAAPERITSELTAFVTAYEEWIRDTRTSLARDMPEHLAKAADRLLERADIASGRMRRGIDLLTEPRVRRAFALANRAMLMQMLHSAPDLAGTPHAPSAAPDDVEPDYANAEHTWRPFQLGFLLLTIEGVVTDGDDRDLVDLIWFPTGGGKTEAYLALAAFTIMYRRIILGDRGAGTTVITRYTLRLLTTQQFQRAATMVIACEKLRLDQPDELGSTPISIGIWVGGSNTPNTFSEARKLLETLESGGISSGQGFQVETCPWCGTRIVPGTPEDEQTWGITATNNAFRIRCLNTSCPFTTGLPISSVDEDLYANPPTMLVGTVDKFARAVWKDSTGVFFGAGKDPGPSLIIQDEFHLISGPLGTIVGLYEAAFDVLMARSGVRPKIVAATATIRNAGDQTRGVFGRKVSLFPPAGVDAANSYFVRLAEDSPGRAYVGVMPQGHTPLTGLVHVAAAQLQAHVELELSPPAEDCYSTLIAYHNSLRELGKTMTLALDDIPSRVKVIAAAEDAYRKLNDDNIVELTSNVPSFRIPNILQRLAREHREQDSVTLLASTNMISVGVDITRLGMMTVVGQPKTTAEYIQATSRVGRKANRPGLVLTLYSPSKPRDRSHYESFVPYHSTLYASVEPSSVTPFSVAARARALHADLVLLVRHALGLSRDADADRFDAERTDFRDLVATFLERAGKADPTEKRRVTEHLDQLVEHWSRLVVEAEPDGGLVYQSTGKGRLKLLRRFTERGVGWPTLDSMRSVDVDTEVWVRGSGT
ncbi:helicase-related protein [Saccharopolyspora sp. NFXS83]|uniref:helicase-related protein n=1 Tax=Saccharopolyspora sp. NFXS83 TaxID=2993560 RepID=UPI00224B4941|nr:helicase-related protein [Saccharopolyspora sp. NFXS83]MCX2729416.1 helicase-related protein [Saccharopolyspora sp. NFXS83]